MGGRDERPRERGWQVASDVTSDARRCGSCEAFMLVRQGQNNAF